MVTTKTLRRQPVFALAGRLTRSARRPPASAQGLALGKPVQSRPRSIASPAISYLTAAASPLTSPTS